MDVSEETAPAVQMNPERPDRSLPGGYSIFFAVLIGLAVLRISLAFVSLPEDVLPFINLILAIVYVGGTILAEFFSANSRWNVRAACIFMICGIISQVGFALLASRTGGLVSGLSNATAQLGLATWCVGLGALLGIGLKDKNLLIPVSIFGAAYDFYLVIAPAGAPAAGLTRELIKSSPKVFTSMAAQVPAVTSEANLGRGSVGSYIGPADLVFLAAFFIVLFKFKMNARLTLAIIVPTLILYMIAVLAFNIPLPALVPIGVCILLANWKHFNLKRDEWIATGFVALLCAGFLTWGLLRQNAAPAPQAEPSPSVAAPATPESAKTPGPANPGQQKYSDPSAAGNTQGPR